MVRRYQLAIVLTVLMLSPGCLGMLDRAPEDTGESVEASKPLDIRIDEPNSFDYNQSVLLTGRIPYTSDNIAVIGSTANGEITRDGTYTSKHRFLIDFGNLPSGTHRLSLIHI